MNDEKRKINDCGFAEDLLSYLYEEMSRSEVNKFKNHLPRCETCNFELSEFSAARSEIRDWKSNSFDRLETPAVLIVYQPARNVIAAQRKPSGSWFSGLVEMFSFHSAVGTSVAAALVIAAVAGYLMLSHNPVLETQSTDLAVIETDSTPVPDANKSTAAQTGSRNSAAESEMKKTDSLVDKQGATVKPTKVSGTNNIRSKAVKSQPVRSQRQQKLKSIPRLIEDDEEDDTLRLSDLLEEIGAR